ncbi:MAG: ABC transporter ATP-binding protein [candidate division Zixibacteria bacterium]
MLLSANNIIRRFRSGDKYLEVLTGADLELNQGELATLSGPSGSGKSTLLYILGGLDRPDSGEVLFKNESVWSLKDYKLERFRNRKIGFVFQMHYLLPDFTAIENAIIPALIAGVPRSDAMEKAKSLFSDLSIYDRKDHYPNQLSGGEQQRTAVSRALINSPELLLADEPTGNLDKENADSLLKLIAKLVETTGVSVLVASHDPRVADMGSRVFRLTDGRIDTQERK